MTAIRPHISAREMGLLFTAPHVAVQILWACQGEIFSPPELRKIILQDSAFCAKIINAATRSCPELIDPAAPLSSALESLSLPVIKSLALQSAKLLVTTEFNGAQAQFLSELWFYSQVGSITAAHLATAISYPAPEEAQLAGLLLNIGMLSLFSKNPERYLSDIGSALSSREVRAKEQISFETDHLQTADSLISGWQLRSFMADAINFSHLDLEQYRAASPLIRMVRLALEVCRSPFALSGEIQSVAKQLFDFSAADTEALFQQAQSEYQSLSPFDRDQQAALAEIRQVQTRLTAVAFSLADQEGIRSQLAESAAIETFVAQARHLYLYNSPAQEAVFFTLDPDSARLAGVPATAQTRLTHELTTSLNDGSLLAEALLSGRAQHSFEHENFELSLFDRQLIRLCNGRGIVCLPLQQQGRPLGGVALGVETSYEAESFSAPQIQLLNRSIAKALAALLAERTQAETSAPAGADVDLIPKLAHEISNPLTIINNYLSVVGSLLEGTEGAEILQAIEHEIQRIGEIMTYYVELKNPPQLPEEAILLNELVLSVVEVLTPSCFTPKEIEILTDFDPALPPLSTKAVVIKQILVNLLKNAAEALDTKGRIALTTRGHRDSDGRHWIEIGVQDNGPGIDKAIQQRLFAPVTSTKGGEHAGLGLNIIKGMVDDIGAKISCHSSTECGTSFKLTIPASDA